MRMKIDGQCHCGEISYEADVETDNVIICHCTDCQTFSGAPYRVSVPVLKENFSLHGEPRTYRKRGDSGREIIQNFCATCGATVFSTRAEGGAFVGLRIGSVRQRAELPPKRQGFCRSAMPWAMDISAVDKVPDAALPPRRS